MALFIRLCFIIMHLSDAFVTQGYLDLRLCGQPLDHTVKLVHNNSVAFVTLKSTTLILREQSRTLRHAIFKKITRNVISIVSIVFVLMRCLYNRIHRNSINRRRANVGSHIWSRRKIFWRHARVSRASFIAHALNNRYYVKYKLTMMHQNAYPSIDTPQHSEDPQCQDIDQVDSLYQSAIKFNHSECTVTLVRLFLLTFVTFGMLELCNENNSLDFTLTPNLHSGAQEDLTIYGNNSLLLGMGPEFSSAIAGDGPGYGDSEVSDNSSSQDSDSGSRGDSDSSYDPNKEKKLQQKKRKEQLRQKRRRKLGPAARKKDLDAQNKKRAEMGPEARRKVLDDRKKRRVEMGPEARREILDDRRKKRAEMGPEARRKILDDRKNRRVEIGPEARREEYKSRTEKRKESKRKDPMHREREYRQRKKARREAQQQFVHEPYDFWRANDVPTDEQLKHFEKDPGTAVAMFRLMAGVPKNHLRRPENLRVNPDVQGIIDRFSEVAGHNVTIRVCAICTKRDVMVGEDFKLLPITHIYLQQLKISDEDLPTNKELLACRRLVTFDGEHYRIDPAGFDTNTNMVTVCAYCEKTLPYSRSTKKLPRQSLAFYDHGTIPARLPKLSLIELLAISKNLVYTSVFHWRPIGGVSQIGLKGHCYVLPIDTVESAATLVTSLPREDLNRHVMVGFMGTKQVYKVVKEMARRLGPLSINPEHVFMWLSFLKQVGNPYYINIDIPDTEEMRGIAAQNMLRHRADVIDCADICNSATVLALDKAQRSELEDVASDLDEDDVDVGIRVDTVLLSQVHTVRNPLDLALLSLKDKIQSPSENAANRNIQTDQSSDMKADGATVDANPAKHFIKVRSELLSDYAKNPELISGAFPCLFPLGLTAHEAGGTGPLSKGQMRTLLLSNDRRFAEDNSFLLWSFDQRRRAEVNSSVSVMINTRNNRTADFIELVNSEGFDEKLRVATEDRSSNEASELKKSLLPLVQIAGHNLRWSAIERKSTLGRLYAMYHFFSLPFIFGTISPSMRDSRLAIRLCYPSLGKKAELPPLHLRTKMISNNPVVAAQVFDLVMRAFFSIICGIPLDHFTGKKAKVDRLLSVAKEEYVGAFGRLQATYGIIEAQSSSSLHQHFHLFGQLDHKMLAHWVHDDTVRKEITTSIDDIITARMPSILVEKEKEKQKTSVGLEDYPTALSLDEDSAHVRYRLNTHRHSFTCWKHKLHTCRMCMPQPEAPETYVAQLDRDPAFNDVLMPKRKFIGSVAGKEIISPPPPEDEERPIDADENRILGFGLGRSSRVEQMQVETNKLTSSLLRCNTSLQPLVTPTQAKAAMFYTSKYCSKDPYELSSTLSLFHQAQISMRKWGSTAADAGTAARNAKCLLQKVLNKIGNIEVSAQQAADAMLGNESFFSTHKFRYVFIWDVLQRVRMARASERRSNDDDGTSSEDEEDHDSDKQAEKIVIDGDGNVTALTQYHQYINKGNSLQLLSLYDYVACIKMIRVHKHAGESIAIGEQDNDQEETMHRRGRRSFKRYSFEDGDCFDASFAQIVSPVPAIPQIVGSPPPRYPGNKPDHTADAATLQKWTLEAKLFVQFYSYMFLPWDSELDPRDPTLPHLQVLPWDDETSWDNFSTILKSWRFHSPEEEDSNMWYKKSTYRILNNMVSNLRQTGSARTLLMKWRSMAADQNEEAVCVTDEQPERKEMNAVDFQIDNEENYDDLAILRGLIRNEFGVDDNLTFRQKQNQAKTNTYISRQLTSLNFIHSAEEINLGQSDVNESIGISQRIIPEASLRPYLKLTVKECDGLRKKITSSVEPGSADTNENGVDSGRGAVHNVDEKTGLDHQESVVEDDDVTIWLTPAQSLIVDALKAAIDGGQLLGFLQGFPGAGKTTTAEKMEDVTGLRVLYCGSTGTASAHFNSSTINSLLSLGLSVDNIDLTKATSSPQLISKIVQLMDNYDLLLIDEASMLTPVTLVRIDLRMRQSLNPDVPFGNKHILLLGDMWQFPPASDLSKPALYQSAVVVATNKRVPNEAYRAGANLFSQFRLFVLNEQIRMEEDYADFLRPLSDMKVQYPITKEWLSKLKVLSQDDLKKPNSPWRFATVAVTGNVERLTIARFKAKLFAEEISEPVVTWVCGVKCGVHGGKTQYSTMELDESRLTGKLGVLKKYFVRGAPCVLNENISTVKGLAKGTRGVMESLVWDPKDFNVPVPDLSTLPSGEISQIPQPKYILIRSKGKLIPIRYFAAEIDKNNKKIRTTHYRTHFVDLLFAVTYHKLQGVTMNALVLSINKHPTAKLRLTLPSLYVGASRVHKLDQLRVLPFWKEDVDYLTSLKIDPLLKLWFENYTKDGIWKSDGLQSFASRLRKKELQRLALVEDLTFFTADELKLYAKNLDLFMGSANKAVMVKILQPFYEQGRKYLSANGNRLLKHLRSELLVKLSQQGALGKLRITILKSYAKRLGFDMSQRLSRKDMERDLQKLMGDRITDINMAPNSDISIMVTEHDSKTDVTNFDDGILVGNEQGQALYSSHIIQPVAVFDETDADIAAVSAPSMLEAHANGSCVLSSGNEPNNNNVAAQICKIFKEYNLHITGSVVLPDGNRYDRIFNIGGGNCYFYAVCQGLEFFGISIDHKQLRSHVGQWIQNPHNAHLMHMHLDILPSGLYHHLKRFPPPPGGWASYLSGMTWQDWGIHVELLGEWVGPMEITPTNHVLEEMGTDIRLNIFDPRSQQIFGDEENIRSDGMDKPIIMVISLTGHYEWLRLREE